METKKNSRQIPNKAVYTANKMYSDIVYGWLQVNSQWIEEDDVRWISKKDVRYVDMAEALGISRQTASTKFKRLLDVDDKGNKGLGLVSFNEDLQRYELTKLPPDIAMLIQNGTLRKMISALSENSISVYAYLFSRYWANKCKPFEFTIESVKKAIGISVATRSNDYIVKDILSILSILELVSYQVIEKVNERGEVKTVFQMVKMNNEIPEVIQGAKVGREKC